MSIYGKYADSMVGGAMGSPSVQPPTPPESVTRREDSTETPPLTAVSLDEVTAVSLDEVYGLLRDPTRKHASAPPTP